MDSDPDERAGRFSLVECGPFHALLKRCGLLDADQLPKVSTAVGLALFAWLLPALLAAAQSLVERGYSGWEFFGDATVYTRFLLGVFLLIATERYADGRIDALARQFRRANLLSPESLPQFEAAAAAAGRRSGSRLAEGALLVISLAGSVFTARLAVQLADTSWEGKELADGVELSWAGHAASLVSNPLFLFLVLRWLWRFVVWTVFLVRISRLPLQLTPLHPDRRAGLGFLSIYPNVFSGVVFATGAVVASSMVKELGLAEYDSQTVWTAMGAWLALNLVIYIGPLLVFAGPLYRTRERALLEYGRLATQHHLAFHRKWLVPEDAGAQMLGNVDASSAADLNGSVEVVSEIRIVPVDRAAVLQLLIAAAVPMLAVILTMMPLLEMLRWIVGTVL